MTRKEAAEKLGVSERTVGAYAQSGRLSVRYLPGKTSPVADFDLDEVAELQKTLAPAPTQANLEGGTQKLETERSLALAPSNFQPSKVSTTGTVTLEVGHLPALAQALIDNLELRRPLAPTEIAAKIAITVPEASTLTGLSEKALRAAIKEGYLPAKRMGRSVRLRPMDVRVWFDRQFSE